MKRSAAIALVSLFALGFCLSGCQSAASVAASSGADAAPAQATAAPPAPTQTPAPAATATAEGAAAPLWAAGAARTKTVVLSDLHLGIDDSFSENVANKPLLIAFLGRLAAMPDLKEVVIAGDFLDEWYLPMQYPSYSDSDEFYRQVAANNQPVMDAFAALMASGVRLVYVPGNHDMLLHSGVLDELLPGIVQARDAEGLGVYYTGAGGNVAIEHGHRYDVFSAPDSISNAALLGSDQSLLPPGYFYARYAASWVTEGRPAVAKKYPAIAKAPDKSDLDQYGAYIYYSVLNAEFSRMTPTEAFEDKTFQVGIAGFSGSYSVADMFPVLQSDGTISAPVLYRNFQRTWQDRQTQNRVTVPVSFLASAAGATGGDFLTAQAGAQYLDNAAKTIDLVVFGHTHIPAYSREDSGKLYLNSGTWVDHNTSTADNLSRTFVLFDGDAVRDAAVYVYNADGTIRDISADLAR